MKLNMPMNVLKTIFVVGVGGTLLLLILPGNWKGKSQDDTIDRRQQKINAAEALETCRQAIMDGISAEDFELLKQDIQKQYGLRVYYNPKDNRYYVADASGRDILRS